MTGLHMDMALIEEDIGVMAQIPEFLIHEAHWDTGTPTTGVITFKHTPAPLPVVLMQCATRPLVLNTDSPMGMESYRVLRARMNYHDEKWRLSVELEQIALYNPPGCLESGVMR